METNVEKIKKESKTGLTSSGLVDHILKNHKIDIHDVDSISLLNMGYYHGYKRYRFVKKANSGGKLSITSFKEIVAIYVMLVETALKNRTIDSLVAESSSGIEDVLDNQLACYIDYSGDTEKYSKKFLQYNETKQNILDTIEYYSDKNEVIKHYLDSDYQIPLWAYFEVITLGQFSRFLGCLVKSSREKLNQDFTIIPKRSNSLELVVNSLIELRNATMHNSAIFDANFSSGVSRALKRQIKQDLGLSTFTCVFIEDYFILLIWILNLLKFDSGILIEYINQFNEIVERFDKSLDNRDIFFKIISTNRKTSIQQLSKFIDKK